MHNLLFTYMCIYTMQKNEKYLHNKVRQRERERDS